jgi:hypothetical protein
LPPSCHSQSAKYSDHEWLVLVAQQSSLLVIVP